MAIPYEDLPLELKQYVRDGTPFPDSRAFSDEALLSAKQFRKQYFRNMQIVEPGSQYGYVDFERLMRNEINNYVKRVLQQKVLDEWDQMLETCSRIRIIWESLLEKNQHRLYGVRQRKKERIIMELKRECVRNSSFDSRCLGQIESFVTGRIFYGSPPGDNWYE